MTHRLILRWFIHGTLVVLLAGVGSGIFFQPPAWAEKTPNSSFTLQEVIDLTFAHYPAVEMGKGRLDEKAGDELVAKAYPNPTFGFQGGHGEVRDPTGRTLFERYFSLSQPLEWPGTRAARQEAAKADIGGARAGFKEMKLNVKANVKKIFYEVLLAETLSDLASRLLGTVTDLKKAVTRRVDSGEAPPFELVKVKVEWMQAQKQVNQTAGNVKTSKAALNQFAAGHLGEHFTLKGDFESGRGNLDEQRLMAEAFQSHPEIQKFHKLIEVAQAKYRHEQQARIPTITVNGAYQRDAGREGIIGGISVPLPIWNQQQGQIAKALGVRRQAEAQLQQAKIFLRRGIAEQVQRLKTASAHIDTFEQGLLKQAQEAVRIARTSFKFGEASLLEVLDAQRTSWHTFEAYALARFDLAVAVTELERLVGKEL